MPEYRITAPNGETFRVKAPKGATREDAIAKVKERMSAQEAQEPPQPPQGPIEGANPLAQREPNRGAARPEQAGYAPTDVGRNTEIAFQGQARGLADLAGAPVDLATPLVNLGLYGAERLANIAPGEQGYELPRVTNPVGGSNSIAETTANVVESATGYEPIDPEDMTGQERLGYNMNRFAAEGLAAGTGLARAASRRFANGVSGSPRLGDSLLRPYQEKGAGVIAADTGAGAGAGAGMTAAQENFPESPLATLVGAAAGGALGSSVATENVNIPATVAERASGRRVDPNVQYDKEGQPTTRRISKEAGRVAQQSYTDPQRAIQRYDENVAEMGDPEYVLPFDLVSEDIGGISMGEGLRTINREPFIERQTNVMAEGGRRLSDIGPRVSNTRAATDYANRQAEGARMTSEREVEALRGRQTGAEVAQGRAQREGQDAASATVPLGQQAPIAANRASRDFADATIERGLDPTTATKNEKYLAPDPDGTLQTDVSPLAEAADEVEAGVNRLRSAGEQLPSGVIDRVNKLRDGFDEGETPTASWKNLSELRRDLSTLRNRARKNMDYDLASSTGRLQRGIDEIAEGLKRQGGETGEALEEAERYYREVYAPVFASGQGMKLRDDVQTSRDRLAGERSEVLDRYYLTESKNTPEVAQDLGRIIDISQTPQEAKDAVRRYLAADMAKAFDADGNVNLKRLQRWREQRAEVLRQPQFKKVADEVNQFIRGQANKQKDVGRLGDLAKSYGRQLRKAQGSQQAKIDAQTGALNLLVGRDPRVATRDVFGSKDPERAMGDIVRKLQGSPEALRAWQRNVADHMASKVLSKQRLPGDEAKAKVNDLREFFDKNRSVLAQVYTPEEMNTLQQVYAQLRPLNNLSLAANTGSQTAERAFQAEKSAFNTGMKMGEVGAKTLFGILKGGGIVRTGRLAADQAFPDRSPEVLQLLARMPFDPELAKYLLTTDPSKAGIKGYNRDLNLILSGAAAGREEGDGGPTTIDINQFKREQGGPRASEGAVP